MKLFQTVIISALWCISSLLSQVNTEAMRDSKQLPGLQHQLNLSYAYISGNDSYPEFFVGRFSSQNSSHINTEVERSIEYERDPQLNGGWYTNNGLMLLAPGAFIILGLIIWIQRTYTHYSEDA